MGETTQSSRRPLVVELSGDIDLENAAVLGDGLCEAMMARVHEHATKQQCRVTWRGLQPWPARVVTITGLDTVLVLER